MFPIRPSLLRFIPMIFVGGFWIANTALAYVRGKKILTNDSPLTEGKTLGSMSPKRSTSTKRPIAPPPPGKPKKQTYCNKPVDCINLVPPLTSVPRWHCDMGDGRTGDCPLLSDKTIVCNRK